MGKVAFTPVSIISGLLAGLIASKLFEFIWSRVADEEAPEPEHRQISWPALVIAMVLEGRDLPPHSRGGQPRNPGRVRPRDRLVARGRGPGKEVSQ